MAIIATSNQQVQALKGVHLYHHGMSQCSQRVRICLEEKQLSWTSHVVNLLKGEHLQSEYGSINPNNVVPTLVHDGKVIIESTDIIQYIDDNFPGPGFSPDPGAERARMEMWLAQTNALKPAIRVLSHQFLFKPVAKKSSRALAEMKRSLSNRDLIDFHSKFSSNSGLEPATVTRSICEFEAAFEQMDECLAQHQWLAGDTFSLADISWMGDLHRVMLMNFPLQRHPNVLAWVSRIKQRPSFKKALLDYEPVQIKYFFRVYGTLLRVRGKSLKQLAVPC